MGSAGDLGTHQRRLRVKSGRVHFLQRISAQVIVAVAAGGGKMDVADPAALHGAQHLQLIIFRRLIDGGKPFFQAFFNLLSVGPGLAADTQAFIHFFQIHRIIFLSRNISSMWARIASSSHA